MSDRAERLRAKVAVRIFESGKTSDFHRLILDVLAEFDEVQEQRDRLWRFVERSVATEPEATERLLKLPEIAALLVEEPRP